MFSLVGSSNFFPKNNNWIHLASSIYKRPTSLLTTFSDALGGGCHVPLPVSEEKKLTEIFPMRSHIRKRHMLKQGIVQIVVSLFQLNNSWRMNRKEQPIREG